MYDEVDIMINSDGDFVIGSNGDFAVVSGSQCVIQDIKDRLRSNDPEWFHHPKICGNFEDLKGKRNTRELGKQAEEQTFNALTSDMRIRPEHLRVRAIPVAPNQINVHVFVDTLTGDIITTNTEIKL